MTLLEKSGQRARLDINADPSVRIEPPKGSAADVVKHGLTLQPV